MKNRRLLLLLIIPLLLAAYFLITPADKTPRDVDKPQLEADRPPAEAGITPGDAVETEGSPLGKDVEESDHDQVAAVVEENGSPVSKDGEEPDHDKLLRAVLKRLTEGDEQTSIEAGMAIREIAKASDLPLLIKTLKRGNKLEAQISLIETMRGLGRIEAAKALRFEIEHGELEAQLAAAEALGYLKNDWAIPLLVDPMITEDHPELQKRAASALARIGSSRAIYALRNSFSRLGKEGPKNAALWAMKVVEGKIDFESADTQIPDGQKLSLNYYGTPYHYYCPVFNRKKGPKPRLLVVIHNERLEPEILFDRFLPLATEERIALIAPYFDNMTFPDYRRFNIRGERADKVLLELIEHIKRYSGIETNEIYLYGEGFGGDFILRFVMVYPKRIARAMAMPEEFTMPDPEKFFPEGIKPHLRAPDIQINLYDFVKSDIAVFMPFHFGKPEQKAGQPAYQFFQALAQYVDQKGIVSRMDVHDRHFQYVKSAHPIKSYLFENNPLEKLFGRR